MTSVGRESSGRSGLLVALALSCWNSFVACGTDAPSLNDALVTSIESQDAIIEGTTLIEVYGHWYPKVGKTPGHLCTRNDPDFDEWRYSEKIAHCRRNVTSITKIKVSKPYGVSADQLKDYQVDHLIPLAVGGSNAEQNLWPVPYALARKKAKFENQIFLAMKDGKLTQADAIVKIRTWVEDNF